MTRVQIAMAVFGLAIVATGIGTILPAIPAEAQEAFAGSWDVVDVQPAPWVAVGEKTYPNEDVARGRITFMADSIQGPSFLNCDKVKYEISKVPPDYLFEGGLTDPERQAKELGFKGSEILQLSMGCISDNADIGMDFDMVDDDIAVFALDNMIYKMKRVKAQ